MHDSSGRGGHSAAPNERTRLNTAFNAQQRQQQGEGSSGRHHSPSSSSALDDGIDDLEDFDWLQWRQYKPKHYLVVLAFALLILGTTGERFTFKLTVDRMTPFRLVLNLMILLTSTALYGLVYFAKRKMEKSDSSWPMTFPHGKLATMAFLDALQFSGLIVSAAGVSPTMTVILLHANTPFVVLGSRLMFDGRVYSQNQIRGVFIIAGAVFISMIRPLAKLFSEGNEAFITSSMFYVLFTGVQGLAMLYKEKCIVEYGQPLDVYILSSWLFFYQLVMTVLLSPFIYMFQGVSSNWDGFPLHAFFRNFADGLRCVAGWDPPADAPYDTSFAECQGSFLFIVGYSACTIVALFCVARVLQFGNQALGRVMFTGVFLAIGTLAVYDTKVDYGYGFFGSNIGFIDVASFVCLLAGMEIYYLDPEPDGQVMTSYVPRK